MRREEEEESEERTVCEFCEGVLPDSGIHIPPYPPRSSLHIRWMDPPLSALTNSTSASGEREDI